MLLKTSDAYCNVILENSREDRELEIEAKKESQKRYLVPREATATVATAANGPYPDLDSIH